MQTPCRFVGIDVSSKELVVASQFDREDPSLASFDNDRVGWKKLLAWLDKKHLPCKLVLEATGTYHLDLALFLHGHKKLDVMVANPMTIHAYARALHTRAKTDQVDAKVLLSFAKTDQFQSWKPPSPALRAFRAVTRYLSDLVQEQTQLKNRLLAYNATETTPDYVLVELESQLKGQEERIGRCQAEAERLAEAEERLKKGLKAMCTIPGVGKRSGVLLLGELALLDREMTADQVVGHAGLDPRPRQSGKKDPTRRISKMGNGRIRGALYMPALVSVQHCKEVKAWYEKLKGGGKPPMVAQIAVMRRLLRVIWVVMKNEAEWDGSKFAPRTVKSKE